MINDIKKVCGHNTVIVGGIGTCCFHPMNQQGNKTVFCTSDVCPILNFYQIISGTDMMILIRNKLNEKSKDYLLINQE